MQAVDNYRATRRAWLAAIAAGRSHYIVSRHWDAMRVAAAAIGVVPGVQV